MRRNLFAGLLALAALLPFTTTPGPAAADGDPPVEALAITAFAREAGWSWVDGAANERLRLAWGAGPARDGGLGDSSPASALVVAQNAGRTEAELGSATLAPADLPAGFVVETEGYIASARAAGSAGYGRRFARGGPPTEVLDINLLASQARTPRELANDKLGTIEQALNLTGMRPTGEGRSVGANANGWYIFFGVRGSSASTTATLIGVVVAWQQLDVSVVLAYLTTAVPPEQAAEALGRYLGGQDRKIAATLSRPGGTVPGGTPGTGTPPVTSAPPVSAPPVAAPPVAAAPPSSPSELRPIATGRTSLRFGWAASAGAESYWVYAPEDGGYRQVAPTPTAVSLDNLQPGSDHCVIVIAQNSAGFSGWSNWACATTDP